MAIERVPVVDLRDYNEHTGERRARFVRVLGEGLEKFGFVSVVGHGIDEGLLARAYEVAAQTFALPNEAKRRYETPEDGRQRGYTSFGVEHAKYTTVPDLKEFWHIGRELPSDHPQRVSGVVPPNRFPEQVPAFRTTMLDLFAGIEGFSLQLFDAIGEYLGEPPSFFREMVRDSNTLLRVIHYPDLGPDAPEGAVRSAAHEDINLLTVLPAATQPGLELMTREGEWMAVDTPPNAMVCDTGDMMALLTAGRLPATTHRVVNPPGGRDGGRYSIPVFLHPNPEYVITPMREGYAEPVKTRDFLFQRLREIGLTK
jgi:isopenicillin N synthase-like dioxygenase